MLINCPDIPNKMEFFSRVTDSISQKQASCMQSLQGSAEFFLAPDPISFFENLPRLFIRNLEKSTEYHISNIGNYLSKSGFEALTIDRITNAVGEKQGRLFDTLGQSFEKMVQNTLDIPACETVQRPVRIEQEIKAIPQQHRGKNSSQRQKQLQTQAPRPIATAPETKVPHQSSKEKQQQSALYVEIQPKSKNSKENQQTYREVVYDRSVSFQQKPNNPEHVPLAASEYIPKRDIAKQLEEKRKRLAERDLKSKHLKSKLIKLQPIARKEDRRIREKEAKEKLLAGIQFVNNLHNNKKSINVKITQWRQDRMKTAEKEVHQSPKYSNRKLQPLRGLQIKDFQGLVGSRLLGESSTKRTEKIASRIERGQKNFTLKKPTPYNLYNVNLTKEEVFQLQYK